MLLQTLMRISHQALRFPAPIFMCVYVCVYMHVCMHVSMCGYVYLCAFVCMCVHICVHVYACMHVYMLCMCIDVCRLMCECTCMWRPGVGKVDINKDPGLLFYFLQCDRVTQPNPEITDLSSLHNQLALRIPYLCLQGWNHEWILTPTCHVYRC